jgi:hypothetical protein
MLLKTTVMESALIDDAPPTWRASCRCFVSDRTPGVTLVVLLGSEREMCPWAISKYFGDLVSNTSA